MSTIDRFLRQSVLTGKDIQAMPLQDILTNEELKQMLSETFGVIASNQDIGDTLRVMQEHEHCQDVFVADAQGEVVGWLTDRDILEDARNA